MGTSPLAQALLGAWARAPKQARDDYERFLRAVSGLLGGEASSEEVQVSSACCSPSRLELCWAGQARLAAALHMGILSRLSCMERIHFDTSF